MTKVEQVWNSFNQNKDKYTCKKCNKVLVIDNNSTGNVGVIERTFIILMCHLDKDCR